MHYVTGLVTIRWGKSLGNWQSVKFFKMFLISLSESDPILNFFESDTSIIPLDNDGKVSETTKTNNGEKSYTYGIFFTSKSLRLHNLIFVIFYRCFTLHY